MKAFGSKPSGSERPCVGINPGANLKNTVLGQKKMIV